MNEHYNPWTVLGQKEIYDNPWIKVTEYDVLNPSGGKGIYGKVHFRVFIKGNICGIAFFESHIYIFHPYFAA